MNRSEEGEEESTEDEESTENEEEEESTDEHNTSIRGKQKEEEELIEGEEEEESTEDKEEEESTDEHNTSKRGKQKEEEELIEGEEEEESTEGEEEEESTDEHNTSKRGKQKEEEELIEGEEEEESTEGEEEEESTDEHNTSKRGKQKEEEELIEGEEEEESTEGEEEEESTDEHNTSKRGKQKEEEESTEGEEEEESTEDKEEEESTDEHNTSIRGKQKDPVSKFCIYAFTLPNVLHPSNSGSSPKLVRVAVTINLNKQLRQLRNKLKFLCDKSEGSEPNENVMLISAEMLLHSGRESSGIKGDIEVKNTAAVVRSMLGHPPTLAYVGRKAGRQLVGKYDELFGTECFSSHLGKGLKDCGFTEWVICSPEKIKALKTDISTDKIVSKEKVHESCTEFLMRLKMVLEPDHLLLE